MSHTKCVGEFRVNLPTIFALEIREENFIRTSDSILSVRNDIGGDHCCFYRREKITGNRGWRGEVMSGVYPCQARDLALDMVPVALVGIRLSEQNGCRIFARLRREGECGGSAVIRTTLGLVVQLGIPYSFPRPTRPQIQPSLIPGFIPTFILVLCPNPPPTLS